MSLKLYLYNNEPDDDIQGIVKRVSAILFLSSLIFFGLGIISGMSLTDLSPQLIISLVIALANGLFIFHYHRIAPWLQLLMLLGLSSVAILDQYNSSYGLTLWASAFLLSKKYKLWFSKPYLIHFFFFLFILILIEISLYRSGGTGYGFPYLIFLASFVVLVHSLYSSEMNRVAHSEEKMQQSIHKLILERIRLKEQINEKQERLKELEIQIKSFENEKEPFNLKDVGLTPAETRIVETLVRTRGSNREISLQLGIKENTVKQHLYKIFNKMGVDDRFQLIDLCQYNFE